MPAQAQRAGALVISLDFELAWGVHDSLGSDGRYRDNLLGAREVVPKMLDLFREYEVEATWATVGLLFAESREEREHFDPTLRPSYTDPIRDPYKIRTGRNESEDPIHFALSLIRLIGSTPGQELASHTYSHYYCLEPGQSVEQFEADLDAAQAIAHHHGFSLQSLVIPRHQVRSDYLPAIRRAGFRQHRTNEKNWISRPTASGKSPLPVRAARLANSYSRITRSERVPWKDTRPDEHGLVDIRESFFLRPYSPALGGLNELRVKRVINAMRLAARSRSIFHLWWHPHNFGINQQQNLDDLEVLLEEYSRLRQSLGFRSYSMKNVGEMAHALRSAT